MARSCQGGVNCFSWTCAANHNHSDRHRAENLHQSREQSNVISVSWAQADNSNRTAGNTLEIEDIGAEDSASPLRVTSARMTASGNAITGLAYRLTNTGSASVVAAKIELRLEETGGLPTVIIISYDGFIGGGGILPGQSLDLTAGLRQELRSPLKSAAMITTFAITERGQAFGRHASEIASDLEEIYREQLRGYDRVRKALANAPAGKEREVAQSALIELGEIGKCNDALAVLSDAFNLGGVDGLRQALDNKRKLWPIER